MPFTQEEAGYQRAGGPHKCLSCEYFRPPYKCHRVEGEIYSEGWCKLWTRKTRRESMPPMLRGASLFYKTMKVRAVRAAMRQAQSPKQRIMGELQAKLAETKKANGNGEKYEAWLKELRSGSISDDGLKSYIRNRAHQNRTKDFNYANTLFKLIGDEDKVATVKTAGGTVEFEKVSEAIFRIRHNGRIISRGRKPLDGNDVRRILKSVLDASAPSVRFVSSEDSEDDE